eukprot:m.273818 g.273818  ORF g.273818 m.273818 type:complete len:504 (-) comp16282_c7_seq24:67-1578(-)
MPLKIGSATAIKAREQAHNEHKQVLGEEEFLSSDEGPSSLSQDCFLEAVDISDVKQDDKETDAHTHIILDDTFEDTNLDLEDLDTDTELVDTNLELDDVETATEITDPDAIVAVEDEESETEITEADTDDVQDDGGPNKPISMTRKTFQAAATATQKISNAVVKMSNTVKSAKEPAQASLERISKTVKRVKDPAQASLVRLGGWLSKRKGQKYYNVRERHSKAIFVNIPVARQNVEHLLAPDAKCDMYKGKAWITVLIDHLDVFQPYVLGLFLTSPFKGWMTKVSLLVKREVDGVLVSGYQTLSLDYENGFGGLVKTVGAKWTQKVPSQLISVKASGQSKHSKFEPGTNVFRKVGGKRYEYVEDKKTKVSQDSHELVKICGTIENLRDGEDEKEMLKFFTARQHKFLRVHDPKRNIIKCAYSPEALGPGVNFPLDKAMRLNCHEIELAILTRFLKHFNVTQVKAQIVAFMLPKYTIVDHHNRILPSQAPMEINAEEDGEFHDV